jgi:hypothetical protein
MTSTLKKLNFKDQPTALVMNAPASFGPEITALADRAQVFTDEALLAQVDFAVVFVIQQAEIERAIASLGPKLAGDAVLWFCYPKSTSKRYKCDFNRDTGWAGLGSYDLEGVRQVAIDEDWSALRFRKVGYIKSLARRPSMALSGEGKQRTTKD